MKTIIKVIKRFCNFIAFLVFLTILITYVIYDSIDFKLTIGELKQKFKKWRH